MNVNQGFIEVEHTADWSLEVWAPDLLNLLIEAARGMYWLSAIEINKEVYEERLFEIFSDNPENMLVSFLSELLYYIEQEKLYFEYFKFEFEETKLLVSVTGNPIISLQKEIKAVTYHNLEIRSEPDGLRVRIVFDV
jgi:SHS2 domain-containing protein